MTRPDPILRRWSGGELALADGDLQCLLRAALARGASLRFRARGLSMSPFIQDTDLITVSPMAGRAVKSGDVIAVTSPVSGKLVIHRAIAAQPGGFLVQGDNRSESDGVVSLEDILGRVTRIERNGTRVTLGLGPERQIIALLVRHGLFNRLMWRVQRLSNPALWGDAA